MARRMKAEGHTGKDIAQFLGISRPTYRYLSDDWAPRVVRVTVPQRDLTVPFRHGGGKR